MSNFNTRSRLENRSQLENPHTYHTFNSSKKKRQNATIKTKGEKGIKQHAQLQAQETRLKKLMKIQNKSLNKLFHAQKNGLRAAESIFVKENQLGETETLANILNPPPSSHTGARKSSHSKQLSAVEKMELEMM